MSASNEASPRESTVKDYVDRVVKLAGRDGSLQTRLRGWVRDKTMAYRAAGVLETARWDTEPLPTQEELRKLGWVEKPSQAALVVPTPQAITREAREKPRNGVANRGKKNAPAVQRVPQANSWQYPPPPYGYQWPSMSPQPIYHYPPPPPPAGLLVAPGAPQSSHPHHPPPVSQPAPPQPPLQAHHAQRAQLSPQPQPPEHQGKAQGSQQPAGRHGARCRSRSRMRPAAPSQPGFRVRLTNVPPELNARDYAEAFSEVIRERVESVDVLRDAIGNPSGVVVVVFSSLEDAHTVVGRYHDGDLNGYRLIVSLEDSSHFSYRLHEGTKIVRPAERALVVR